MQDFFYNFILKKNLENEDKNQKKDFIYKKACQIYNFMIWLKSLLRMLAAFWPRGQAVKTSPFHGGNTGSIPVGVIKWAFVLILSRCGSIGRAADL